MLFKLDENLTISVEQLNSIINKLIILPGIECFNAISILKSLPKVEDNDKEVK